MLKKIIIFVLTLFLVNVISAVAYSSAGTGNWNSATTWSPNGIPGSGDTVTINPGNTITISDSRTIGTGSGTSITNNGVLAVSGSLNLNGDIAMNTNSVFNMNPGSSLTMNTFNILSTGKTILNFVGNSGSRITVTSSGGAFSGGANNVVNFQYVDFSGLGSSTFTFGSDIASGITMQNSRWINYNGLTFSAGTVNNPINIVGGDFRLSNTAINIFTMGRLGVSAGGVSNTISNSTFSAPSSSAQAYIDNQGFVFKGNIVYNFRHYTGIAGEQTISDNFLHRSTPQDGGDILLNYGNALIKNNFFYPEIPNSHTIDGNSGGGFVDITENIFQGSSNAENQIVDSGRGKNVTKNIMIGSGALVTQTSGIGGGKGYIKRNTVYSKQNGRVGHVWGTETGLYSSAGTYVANNIVFDSEISTWDSGIQINSPYTGTPDQLTFSDYNLFKDFADVYVNVSMTGKTEGVDYGFGKYDKINVDPQFVDPTRNLAKWDLSLGGPGTEAHAIQEMLKMNGYGGSFNPAYSQSNLMNYIRQGFTPQNPLLDNAGDPADGSPDIGAVDFGTGTFNSDVNLDGKVNIIDLVLVIRWQGKNNGQGDWNNYKHLDVNNDNVTSMLDVNLVIGSM
jgi:hypothetical protein